MVLETEDENRVFNIAFCTPPENSNRGSAYSGTQCPLRLKRIPIKGPFVETGKGFFGIRFKCMTYPDKTMYPVASCMDC